MFPRPDIDGILSQTADNIVTGKRNPVATQNRKFFFNTSQTAFLAYLTDAGIRSFFNDLSPQSVIKLKNNNNVTRFISDRLELGVITKDMLNPKYYFTVDNDFLNDINQATQEENNLYSEYVEEII